MAVVFVTQDNPKLGFAPALAYGEKLAAVFPPGQVVLSPQTALNHARRVLQDMTADDWLVLSGDPVVIGICWAVVAEYLGKVRALKWDARELCYVPVEVNMVDRVSHS